MNGVESVSCKIKMIGKHVKGKSFRGLLNYLFGKEGARYIGGNMEGTNPRELATEFGLSRKLNPKVSRAVYHASLSLPHHESLDDDTWHEIAQKYLQAMGFKMNQYIVVRHVDREHDHAHIAASRIQLDGTTVSDSWDKRRSEVIIRKLEKEYNLQSVPASWEKDKHSPSTGERRQLARTGEESVRVKLQRSLDEATQDHPIMPELIEQLQQQGINVRVGYTRTGKVKGISYQLDSVAFSGTHLGKAYTFAGLQKHRGVSYIPKRDDQLIQKLIEHNPANDQAPLGRGVGCGVWGVGEKEHQTTSGSQASSSQDDCIGGGSEPRPIPSSHSATPYPQHPIHDIPAISTKRDDEPSQTLIEQNTENATPTVKPINLSPAPEPANWEPIRLKLNQQYNLPNSLLTKLYQQGWLYGSQTGQAVFVERTLDDVPTQTKQLELTGDFTAIPLNSEPSKSGSFWVATDTTVKRAVLLSNPIEVLSVIGLESTIDKQKRKPTLYWSVGESQELPLDFLRSLDTVIIAFKDHEQNQDLVSGILAELPQAQRVSPGQAGGWNKMLIDSKPQPEHSPITQLQEWEL
jgi:hypothetical protein